MALPSGYAPAGPHARPVYIVDGARTPFLKSRGVPGPFRASELATAAGAALLARQPFEPEAVDQVILGCVAPGPDEANIGRIVGLRLGCGEATPGFTVQRNCASGMQSIDCGAMDIACGRASLVLAGGAESMSHAPVMLDVPLVTALGRWARGGFVDRLKVLMKLRARDFKPVVGLLHGLTDPLCGLSMGQTAENLTHDFAISRREMDGFALESHRRLAAAQDAGALTEIVPAHEPSGKVHAADDGLRRDSSLDALARLKPVFDPPFGNVTAGNSAQVTDGAAWVLLASGEALKEHGLTPMARLVDCRWAALAPSVMGLGPVHAMAALLAGNGLAPEDVGLWEINEAFAAQVLACLRAWADADYCRDKLGLDAPLAPIPMDRLNVDGGAVALGHPVGASGARLVLHMAHALRRANLRLGVASLCVGGGQGGAMLLESQGDQGGTS